MIIIRCTTKVLKELGIPKVQIKDYSDQTRLLQEWYANLFYLDRRKCLLFTHAGTLFSFVVAGVSRKDIKVLPELFRKELSKALFYEEFSSGQIEEFMKRAQEITIAKTTSRSVLASMNQILFEYPYILARFAHLGSDEAMVAVNRELNTMFRSAIGEGRHDYGVPIECFREMITGEKPQSRRCGAAPTQSAYVFEARMIQYAEGADIVRRVAVSGSKNLVHLAQVILDAFDFDCDHCFGFYGDINKHPGREQTEVYEVFVDAGAEPINDQAQSVEQTKISFVFKDVGKRMLFVFDYGDDWRFIVEFKEIQENAIGKLPRVLSRVGVAPPQYPSFEE